MNTILTKPTFTNSLTSKLTLCVVCASVLTLLIACAAFVSNEAWMLRESQVRELTAIAEVTAANSTAVLAFGQTDSAFELLVSVSGRSGIREARLYDRAGKLFAGYEVKSETTDEGAESGSDFIAEQEMGSSLTEDGLLQVTVPVLDRGDQLGYLQVQAATVGLGGQLPRYAAIVTSLVLASLMVSIVAGSLLQRVVSDPLLRLTAFVRQVQQQGDWSVRVQQPANDEIGEIGELGREFNAMLAEIDFAQAAQERTCEELRDARAELEERLQEHADKLLHATAELELNENRVRAIVRSIRSSKVVDLNKTLELVNEQRDDLPGFMETDTRGKQLPKDLIEAGQKLAVEHGSVLEQLNALTSNLEQIRAVVAISCKHASVEDDEVHASA